MIGWVGSPLHPDHTSERLKRTQLERAHNLHRPITAAVHAHAVIDEELAVHEPLAPLVGGSTLTLTPAASRHTTAAGAMHDDHEDLGLEGHKSRNHSGGGPPTPAISLATKAQPSSIPLTTLGHPAGFPVGGSIGSVGGGGGAP